MMSFVMQPDHLMGMPVTIVPAATSFKQFRFPRSKKRRIRKKWSQRISNYRTTYEPRVMQMDNRLLIDNISLEKLKRQLASQE